MDSRLERAARALLAASSRIEAETMCVVPRRLVDALHAALALPADEPEGAGEAVAWACAKHAPSNMAGSRWVMVAEWTRDGGKVPDRCCESAVALYTHHTPRAEAAPGHTDLMVTPESVGPYVAAEAVRDACAKACDDLVARANEKVREWSMSDHGREAAAMVERYHASAYREAAAAIRSLPLPAAPASAEGVADSIIDAIVAETRAHLERMERLWGDLSRAASSLGGA